VAEYLFDDPTLRVGVVLLRAALLDEVLAGLCGHEIWAAPQTVAHRCDSNADLSVGPLLCTSSIQRARRERQVLRIGFGAGPRVMAAPRGQPYAVPVPLARVRVRASER
jgi:hypothetical protein